MFDLAQRPHIHYYRRLLMQSNVCLRSGRSLVLHASHLLHKTQPMNQEFIMLYNIQQWIITQTVNCSDPSMLGLDNVHIFMIIEDYLSRVMSASAAGALLVHMLVIYFIPTPP